MTRPAHSAPAAPMSPGITLLAAALWELVVRPGRIKEQGTHAELLDQQGLYARFWDRQSGGFINVEDAAE